MNFHSGSQYIIAIDFGTAGTGFAFSLEKQDFVREGTLFALFKDASSC
jgi:hypothetical protein